MTSSVYTDRISQLCAEFRLPTVGSEAVPRFRDAGQSAALETLLEVLELEAEDRKQRRIARLYRASRLPPGKTWNTFEQNRLPVPLQQQLHDLVQGTLWTRG